MSGVALRVSLDVKLSPTKSHGFFVSSPPVRCDKAGGGFSDRFSPPLAI